MDALLEYFHSHQDSAITLLREMVEMESGSNDKPGIDALAQYLSRRFQERGAVTEILPDEVGGNALRARWRSGAAGKPVMMLGHLDTVWPKGTLVARPFRISQGRAFGPGVFDMKGGILLCLLVCQAMQEGGLDPGKDVVFLFTADEEIGTRAGLAHLQAFAPECRAVLCLEPSLPGGKAKTFRKGVGGIKVKVRGIPAHAGVDHEKGANAIVELSRLILQLQGLTDYARGITVNAGRIQGGTAANVVPAEAEVEMDFRVSSPADAEWLSDKFRTLVPTDARCKIEVCGGLNRPPLERSAAVVSLYETARRLAAGLGMDLGEGGTGGGSDGSFTAAMGIPTLDGLGIEGDGAHALHEQIILDDIPRRSALLARLVQAL